MEHITINVSNDLSIYKRYNEGDIIFVPAATTHKVMLLLGNNKVRMIAYNAAILKSTALQIDFSDLLQKREHYVITSQSKGYEEITERTGIFYIAVYSLMSKPLGVNSKPAPEN